MKTLKAKTKVDIIRRGLSLLKEATERNLLRESFRKASEASRGVIQKELDDLDALTDEGLA
jgi:hypothetical protein